MKPSQKMPAQKKNDPFFENSRIAKQNVVKILGKVFSDKQTIEQAMETVFEESMSKNQGTHVVQAWYRDILAGVIRYKFYLDEILETLSLNKKPTGKLLRYLYCGSYQILFQQHSKEGYFKIVNEWVDAIKTDLGLPPSRFANALLRKICDQSQEWKNAMQVRAKKSFPTWIVDELVTNFGEEQANLFARSVLDRPVNWLRKKTSREPELLDGKLEENPDFIIGEAIVQDLASQKIIEEVTSYLPEGSSILDYCSAPGGKSVGLVWNGFKVTSTDLNSKRLATVFENRERLKLQEEWEILEMKELEKSTRVWDAIWIDAPCTGTGVLRRHPEIALIKDQKTKQELLEMQKELIKNARKFIGSKGYIIYSVCSVLPSEGSQQVRNYLKENSELKLLKEIQLGFPNLESDGFYAALLTL